MPRQLYAPQPEALWSSSGEEAPPIPRRDLLPPGKHSPVHAGFIDWAADIPTPSAEPVAPPPQPPQAPPRADDFAWAPHRPPPRHAGRTRRADPHAAPAAGFRSVRRQTRGTSLPPRRPRRSYREPQPAQPQPPAPTAPGDARDLGGRVRAALRQGRRPLAGGAGLAGSRRLRRAARRADAARRRRAQAAARRPRREQAHRPQRQPDDDPGAGQQPAEILADRRRRAAAHLRTAQERLSRRAARLRRELHAT